MELRHPRAPALTGAGPARGRELAAAACRVALLAGPTVLAFASGGYFEGPRLVAAIGAWALVAVLALTVPPGTPVLPRATSARMALGGLAAFTAWVLLSRAWAPLAGPAGEDVQRDVLALGALTAGWLAWRPRAWAAPMEWLLAAGTVVVVGYGLLGRLLPGVVHQAHSLAAGGRLDQPLTYWNAMGALAAIGLVLCARVAGDTARPDRLRVPAAAAAVPLALGVYLSYSRGALAALACGLLVLLILAPTWSQLRAIALVLELGALACVVASRLDGVASLGGTLAHRERQGAVMLVVLLAAIAAAGAVQAVAGRAERRMRVRLGPVPVPAWGRRAAWVAAIALAVLPYAAAVAGERGPDHTAFGATAQRFGSVGSNRYAYWRVAVRTFADHPLKGAGAASFRVEWLRERPFPESVRDAHSLYLETLAELGIVGLALLGVLVGGVALAARRTLAADPALAIGPAAALAVWAVHAGVDWDWEMPALTLVAVTLAGMLLAADERGGATR